MAISEQRFKILAQRLDPFNKETNISTKDFTAFNENVVYNTIDEIVKSEIIDNKENEKALVTIQTGLKDLSNVLKSKEVENKINETVNKVVSSIKKLDLPETTKDIISSLEKVDENNVKDFIKEAFDIGGVNLQNNIELLKTNNLNSVKLPDLNKNIISGLSVDSMLKQVNKLPNSFSKEELLKSNNLSKLNMLIPSKGVKIDPNNAFKLFNGYCSDFIKSKVPLPSVTALTNNNFLTNILSGDITSSISNLRSAEITSSQKKSLINLLNTTLSSHLPNSAEYKNILTAKGKLLKTPLISPQRRSNNIQFSNLTEKLGSYVKNLSKVELPTFRSNDLSSVEQALYSKMSDLKKVSASSISLQSTPNEALKKFNISSLVPPLTQEQETYLNETYFQTDSHTNRDLHPTTEVFYT